MSNDNIINSAYFILTENCNLRCAYCFEKDTRAVAKYMSKETALKGIDFLVKNAVDNGLKEFKITFFGGEPMLCPDLIIEMLRHTKTKQEETGLKAITGIITNATIYNEEVLKEWYNLFGNSVNVQLSIDGIPEIQNVNRPCANSCMQSSDLVEETVAKYKKFFEEHKIPLDNLHIHACLSKASLPYMFNSYMYFTTKLGIMNSNFAWVIEERWSDEDLQIFSNQMSLIIKRLCNTTTNLKRFPLKNLYKCSGCSAGTKLITIDTEGNIYPCHRFFFYDKNKREDLVIGNIYNENPVDEEKRKPYKEFDCSKVSNYPCQVCMATNYSYTGDLYKMPNDYAYKFMEIINHYKDTFTTVIEKKLMLKMINDMGKNINYLNQKVEMLESILKEAGIIIENKEKEKEEENLKENGSEV